VLKRVVVRCCGCDLVGAAALSVIYRFSKATHPTIDGIGPAKVAYQMTLSSSHSINAKGLQDAAAAVGATKEDPLRLCMVVPKCVMAAWMKKNSAPIDGVAEADLLDKVKLYVVGLPVTRSSSAS
jgi:hypothetical protein